MSIDSARNMISTARRCLGGLIRGSGPILEDYSMEERRALWPPASPLQQKHLAHCRVLESREKMLEFMPRNGVCAEIGISVATSRS